AVVCLDVESGTIPVIAGQIDFQPAVDRLAAHVAVDVAERDAAVDRMEVRRAAEVVNRDATVLRRAGQDRVARHGQIAADRPVVGLVARAGTIGPDRAAGSLDANAGGEATGVGVAGGVRVDGTADQDIAAIPAANRDSAVRAAVDGDRVAAPDRVLAN